MAHSHPSVLSAPSRAQPGGEYAPRVLQAGVGPIPRCCPVHPDWPMLAQHLLDDFPDVSISDVVRELRQAKEGVDNAGLIGPDRLLVGELLARQALIVLREQTRHRMS